MKNYSDGGKQKWRRPIDRTKNSEYELTWLQDLDDDALVVESVDSLVDFGVLASANLLDDLVVVLGPERSQS